MENTEDEIEPVQLSKETETEGFDVQAGETWIYPTNYPVRDYQYNIIQKALLKNTLVSLPTGLGKTFIAAVVMYNIYRWYPHSKVIFMAPTKPLVKQQVDACYNIMAIPPEVTAELTGAKASSSRTNIWTEKRVFFVTPQVLQNDLNKIAELGSKIKCLVFDEAHKAKGNHAYCEVIRRLLAQNHKYFRVLALSATPGSTVNDVLEVIQNLLISHVEFRTEESLDVAPYVFQRSLETLVVPLDKKLEEVRDDYLKIVEQYVKTLIRFNIVQGNCCSLTKGKIFMLMKNFQEKNRGTGSSNYSEIMRCLTICLTLYHALELLIRHGLRNFLSFYDEHIEKPLLRKNAQLRCIINNVREYLGPIPNIEVLPDGTYPEIPKDIRFGHPKYYKLRDVLVSHFSEAEKNTRVIVFFEYRESVMEAHTMLLQSRPLLQPKIFIGQGSGITQKLQLGVVKAFREGRCNTLLATSIGEEGLDVGEVDLIVCFDIANKSPIRMVQRMGRTGRKREGRIVVLVTEGKEQQTLKDCLIHKNNISTYVLESKQLNLGMYPDSPRLVPKNLTPKCEKMFITVKTITKKKSVKDMLKCLSSNTLGPVFSQEVNILNYKERIPQATMLFNKGLAIFEERKIEKNPIFSRFIEKQRTIQKTHKVKHSRYTKILTDLLCSADFKRFNLPTQVQSLTQGIGGKCLKQRDIRNMFTNKNSQLDFQPTETKTDVIELEDIPTQVIAKEAIEPRDSSEDSNFSKELFTLISNYLFTQMANPLSECRHCPRGFRCEDFTISTAPSLTNNNWVPSEDILDTITLADLEMFTMSLNPTYHNSLIQLDESNFSQMIDNADSQLFKNVNFTQLEKEAEINSGDIVETEKSFNFEAPKTYGNLLSKFGNSIFSSQKTTQDKHEPDSKKNKEASEITEKRLLDFFMLESLTDICCSSSPNCSQDTIIYSQNLSDLDPNVSCDKSSSPILSLHERKQKYGARETGTKETHQSSGTHLDKNDKNLENKVSIDLNDFRDLSYFGILNSQAKEKNLNERNLTGIAKICDLSQFGISPDEELTKQDVGLSNKAINDDNYRNMDKNNCDNDIFSNDESFHLSVPHISSKKKKNLYKSNLADIAKICDLSQFGILPDEDELTKQADGLSNKAINDDNDRNIDKNNSDNDIFCSNDESFHSSLAHISSKEKKNLYKSNLTDIAKICDLSQFGILPDEEELTKNAGLSNKAINDDSDKNMDKNNCDNDIFSNDESFHLSEAHISRKKKKNLNTSNLTDIAKICDLSQFGILPDEDELTKQADGLSNKGINDDSDRYMDKSNSDNDIFSNDESFHLSGAHSSSKAQCKDSVNFSRKGLYEKLSTPEKKKCYNRHFNSHDTLNYQVTRRADTSVVLDMNQTVVDIDFNLLTQHMEFSNKCDIDNSKLKGTQEKNFIDDCEESEVFAITTQRNNSNKNKILISEEKNRRVRDIDQTLVDMGFNLPTQQIDSKKSETRSKPTCTQKSTFIDKYEDNDIFNIPTQPNNSNKSNILTTTNNLFENKGNFDSSALEEEIECIDLTLLSPTQANEKRILSCETQIPITQMLGIINKTTQKENINANEFDVTLTPRVESPVLNKSKSTWINRLSTKKNVCKQKSSVNRSKSNTRPEVNPYLFSISNRNNKRKTKEKESTSSDEFEDSVFLKPEVSSVKHQKKFSEKNKKQENKRCKKSSNEFLDLEAQLSENENLNISGDEDEENMDFYEKSFVNDETQNLDTQMHAKYLQSIRSPAIPGRFKIPVRPALNISNVYSQPPSTEVNTYLEDSFCVDIDDNELTQQQELSQLEILEKKLREKKKRKKSEQKDEFKPKRRRVIHFASDDSD